MDSRLALRSDPPRQGKEAVSQKAAGGRVRRPQLPRPAAAGRTGHGGVPIPVALPVSRVDEAFDEPRTLRDPKLAARVRPFIDELIWYVRALASLGGRLVEPGSP